MPASVTRNDDKHRYEVEVDGELAGFIEFTDNSAGTVRDMPHTRVFDGHEGQGLAGQMAQAALEDVRASGMLMIPTCPYLQGYLRKHSDQMDLVPADVVERLELH